MFAGRGAVSDQRGVDDGRLDRVRLSEAERQIPQVQRHDTRRDGLLDVASFRKSKHTITVVRRARARDLTNLTFRLHVTFFFLIENRFLR